MSNNNNNKNYETSSFSFFSDVQTTRSDPADQLYSLQSGRLVAPSPVRLAYFQNARYNGIIPMSSYGYKKRSDRTTHDDAVTSPHTSCPKAIWCIQDWYDNEHGANTLHAAKLSCMGTKRIIRTAPVQNEWIDAAQHQQQRSARVNPHVLASMPHYDCATLTAWHSVCSTHHTSHHVSLGYTTTKCQQKT